MAFPVVLAFLPLAGAIVATGIAVLSGRIGVGSIFKIEGEGNTVFIIGDDELKHPINEDSIESLGFDVRSNAIPTVRPDQVEDFPTGEAWSIEIIQAKRIRI